MRSTARQSGVNSIRFETASQSRTGQYVYAIADAAASAPKDVRGIDACEVGIVTDGAVSAVVSACARQRIRPERANLAAHNEVLKTLMADTTVLPMVFGTVADGEDALRRMLRRNQKEFVRELNRVRGKVEMGLRLIWDVPNIFEFFVDTHDDLREARDRLSGRGREPSQDDKIELGRLFDRMLGEERDAQFEKLEGALSESCREVKRLPPKDVNEVANLCCLVDRDGQKAFEDAVFRAANLFDNNYSFDMNGPWAPHNFVEMNLKLNER